MNIKISVLDLIDLQAAIRRSKYWLEEQRQFAEKHNMVKSLEVYTMDIKRGEALYQKLEQAFDEAYPPSKGDAA